MSRRRILIDADDVLADFMGAALKLINDTLGADYQRHQIDKWDIFDALGIPEQQFILDDAVINNRFCANIEPIPGAREMVDRLQHAFGNVYVVTSPYDAPNWMNERQKWLEEHMGVPLDFQLHARAKHTVAGCVLIDDKPQNLEAWSAHWPEGLPILRDQYHNKEEKRFPRACNGDEVINLVEAHFQKMKKAYV